MGYEVSGILKMHGMRQEMTIPFTFDNNIFKSSFTVNRSDYNIGKTTGLQGTVGSDINLDISIPVTQN